ncbi:MAG: phospho-N-acetylmuramoyl-pentapeptide-transferase [Candidatus Eremiobacteraeota bacterium]|nr:phospho-N-acetylmuramoyl-pentapeptide-transferase [Candidatus Eremiobacteraeota bacterium]
MILSLELVAAFAIEAVAAGTLLLLILRRLQLRQHAYEDAPKSHQVKSGTPTMGGLLFFVPLVTLFFLDRGHDATFDALLFLISACAAIGFLDDYLSIVRGRNLGLRARTKFLATALVAIVFMRWITDSAVLFPRDTLFSIGSHHLVVAHWLWLALGIIAITGTIHAVNLTDGLDGLATGAILPPLVVFFLFAHAAYAVAPLAGPPAIVLAMIGGCLGFLFFNRHPAKMFMGDTGSLALGAALSGIAILSGQMLLLILVGGLFVAEALSVIIQVAYFKRTKKRVFRMSPLHHHFELGGWSETKVTSRFWAVSALLSLAGLAIVR